jgi:hypothetical protein
MTSSMPSYQICVGFAQREHEEVRHWILLLVSPEEDTCMYCHIVGDPGRGEGYRLEVQSNRIVNGTNISGFEIVGEIQERDKDEFIGAVVSIRPRFSQRWVVRVICELQRRQLLPSGTFESWLEKMEDDPYPDAAEAPETAPEDDAMHMVATVYTSGGVDTAVYNSEIRGEPSSPQDLDQFLPQKPREWV